MFERAAYLNLSERLSIRKGIRKGIRMVSFIVFEVVKRKKNLCKTWQIFT